MIPRIFLLFLISIFGYQLYAQDTLDAQKVANAVGTEIVCDSLGRPYGDLYIIDNEFDSCLVGYAITDLFTKQDMVHIDKVQVSDIWIVDDDGICCERVSKDVEYYSVILAIIQCKIGEDIKGGFLVYPEWGLMSKPVSRTIFPVKFQINNFLESPCYRETTSQ